MKTIKASDIIIKKQGKVKSLIPNSLQLKFIEMGIVEGAQITLLNKTFGGNNLLFDVEGCLIALRKEEAQLIEVSTENC